MVIECGMQNARFVTATGQAYRGYAALRRLHFGTYKGLKSLQRAGHGIWKGSRQAGEEIHHLIEKRFLNGNYQLSGALKSYLSKADEIVSVALKREEHVVFTARWQAALGKFGTSTFRRNLDVDDILAAAKDVYRDAPELYNALLKQLL